MVEQKTEFFNPKDQEKIDILNRLSEWLSKPFGTLEEELRDSFGLKYDSLVTKEGQIFKIWNTEQDKQRYPDGMYTAIVDDNGRIIKQLSVPFYKLESWEYDEDGYMVQYSIRRINNLPSGWVRNYRYIESGSGKELSEIVYQEFETPIEEAHPTSNATHDQPESMRSEDRRGNNLLKKSFNLPTAVSDLLQKGEDVIVTFENGVTNQPIFIGYT